MRFLLGSHRSALPPLKIGTPSEARIISLVQPAQHLYFHGSAIEIARLSRAVSRPEFAQLGHRVQ
jgi:hypothetical protein